MKIGIICILWFIVGWMWNDIVKSIIERLK